MFSRTRTKDVFDQINGSNDCEENEHSSGDKDVDHIRRTLEAHPELKLKEQ